MQILLNGRRGKPAATTRRERGRIRKRRFCPFLSAHFVVAGTVDLLSLELVFLELLAVLVLFSLEVLLSPGEELALPFVLSSFLPSLLASLAIALLLL